MKRIAFMLKLTVAGLLFSLGLHAQTGATFSNPIDVGTYGVGSFSYTDTKTTNGYGNDYASSGYPFYGQASEDIFYRVTLLGDAQLTISHCNSGLSDTYLHVLNEDGSHFQSLDDYGPLCSGTKASMSLSVPAGTYYIVSEGYGSSNGSITTQINISIQSIAVVQHLNFIRTWTAHKPFTSFGEVISDSRSPQEITQVTDYSDGFGRMVQRVARQLSPQQKDVVDLHQYDNAGRETRRYLPFASNAVQSGDVTDDGNFKQNGLAQQTAFNQGLFPNESFYYSQVDLENSPYNRTLKRYPQGNSWVGSSRGEGIQYLVNTDIDNARIWNIAAAQGSLPSTSGHYQAGQLYKTIRTDEKGLQTIEYKDKEGRVVLKKVQLTAAADGGGGSPHAGWACTYFVYDGYNNLRFIITPKAVELIDGSWTISSAIADGLCYRYEYNVSDQVVIRKIPGAGEEWFVFDRRKRLVMSQDANQRNLQKWVYYQYDGLDRLTATGLMSDPSNYNNLGHHQNAAASSSSYPNLSGYATEVLTSTYYDNYNWTAGTGLPSTLDQSNVNNTNYFYQPSNAAFPYPQPIQQSSMTRGMITGTKTEVMGSNGSSYLFTVNFYDDKGRKVQSQGQNVSGQIDKVTVQYDWLGNTLRTLEEYRVNNSSLETHNVLTKLQYDNKGRVTGISKLLNSNVGGTAVNGTEKTIATYQYNELGKLKTKTLGTNSSNAPLETLTFDYHIRDWMAGINKNFVQQGGSGNYFGMELAYDKTASVNGSTSYSAPNYTGNVTGLIWKTKGDNVARKFDFGYDNANQLALADFTQNTEGSTWDKTYIDYSVNSIAYDVNGNITALNRNGFNLGGPANIDNLTYNYGNSGVGNKLQNVLDQSNNPLSKLGDFHYAGSKSSSAVDYAYDANGNLSADANKSISSILYNTLNLPAEVTVSGKGTISYVYDAAGNKLKKIVQENNATVPYNGTNYQTNITTVTTYIGGLVYKSVSFSNPALNALQLPQTLQFISHEEGRARIVNLASGNKGFVYDYSIRDNVGNVRVMLTDEQQQDTYPAATLEGGAVGTEQKFYNIVNDANHIIPTSSLPWYASASGSNYQNNNGIPSPPDPTINRTGTSSYLYRLNGATGDRFGMGIALKVMAGDVISVLGRSVWHNNGQTTSNTYPISNVLTSFLNAFGGTSVVTGKGTANGAVLNTHTPTTSNLSSWLNNVPAPGGQAPKAYINWVLFDEQFKPVQSGSGYDPVSVSADVVKAHVVNGINVTKSGYLYVYCSNESNQDVYFDNLQVVHERGPLLEERHYYPDGLAMHGISSAAFGKLQSNYGYQGKELEASEFFDGSGFDQYDFHARYYDPQLGRWWAADPSNQFASPYLAMGNNWINGTDPSGRWFGIDDLIFAGVGAIINVASQALSGNINSFGDFAGYFITGALAGEATLYGGPVAGGAVLGLGNNLTSQLSNGATLSTLNVGSLLMSTGIGAVTGGVSGAISNTITPYVSNALASVTNSPVLQRALTGAITGAITGGTLGGVSSLINGGNFWTGFGNGAASGAVTGGLAGGISGYKDAKKYGFNPWTGRPELLDDITEYSVMKTSLQIWNPKIKDGIYVDAANMKMVKGAYEIQNYSWKDFVRVLTDGTMINPTTNQPITAPTPGQPLILNSAGATYTFYARTFNAEIGLFIKFTDAPYIYKFQFNR